MVRRGSPVRVRKRALTKALHTQGFRFPDALHFVQRAQAWNRFWNSQTKKAANLLSSQASARQPRPRFGWVVRNNPDVSSQTPAVRGVITPYSNKPTSQRLAGPATRLTPSLEVAYAQKDFSSLSGMPALATEDVGQRQSAVEDCPKVAPVHQNHRRAKAGVVADTRLRETVDRDE
jgi:hypothetical protein